MEIITRSLPSTGWKSGLPASFDMRPFSGKESIFIAEAVEKKSLKPLLLQALPNTLSIPIEMLTIQDAHALLFQQRMMIKDTPLKVLWQCHMPLFEYADGVFQDPRDDEVALNTFPCDAHNVGIIDESAVTVRVLNVASDEFDLPRMINYEAATESRFNWFVAHMGVHFDRNYSTLEQQEDLKLWMRLTEWAANSDHGIPANINLTCPVCKRESERTWELLPKIFDNA